MSCEPFECERCGQTHDRCKGHVTVCPNCGRPDITDQEERRRLKRGDPCSKCGAAPTERPCRSWPRISQEVCTKHGGNAPLALQAAAARREEVRVRAICDQVGLSRDVDPGEALLELVHEAAGNVEFYRQLVQDLPPHPTPDALEIGDDGDPHWRQGDPGLYGRTYHQSGVPTGEAKRNILLVMFDDERDRLAKYADLALKAGVEERRVRLAEADAREFFAGIGEAIKAAALTPEQTEVFRATLIARFRGSVDGGGPIGSAEPVPLVLPQP